MKINKLLNIIKSLITVFFSLLLFVSCNDDDDFGADTNKVIATVFDMTGTTLVNLDDVSEFSVTPRAGSTFTWTANGAVIQPVEGTTTKVNVLFNQIGIATVSVYETTFGGAVSETYTMDVNVLQLCTYSIDMRDSYGDGWNGASVEISFTGGADITPVTLELTSGSAAIETFSVPSGYEMTVTFNSGSWDSEIAYAIFDNPTASGTPLFFDTPPINVGVAFTAIAVCP